MTRGLIGIAVLVALAGSRPAPLVAAGQPAEAEKVKFIEAICAGTPKQESCLSAGRLVIARSLNWIMFDACSLAGERDVVVRCFDLASELAGKLTGDPRYMANRERCHRFSGDEVDEAKLLCYRSAFKYRNYYAETYGHLWDYANTQ